MPKINSFSKKYLADFMRNLPRIKYEKIHRIRNDALFSGNFQKRENESYN